LSVENLVAMMAAQLAAMMDVGWASKWVDEKVSARVGG
jgi:hypothetical protein